MKFLRPVVGLFVFLTVSRLLVGVPTRTVAFLLLAVLPVLVFSYDRTMRREFMLIGSFSVVAFAFIVYRHDLYYQGVDPDRITIRILPKADVRLSIGHTAWTVEQQRALYDKNTRGTRRDILHQARQLELRVKQRELDVLLSQQPTQASTNGSLQ